MFTGIVEGTATVETVEVREGLRQLTLSFPESALEGIEKGASVSIAGVCLTAVAFDERACRFDVIAETLRVTTLGELEVGDRVNFERAATYGSEIGGHLLSGHASGVVEVASVVHTENNTTVGLRVAPELGRYVLAKGYVALDGCSLTVGAEGVVDGVFVVHLIPETLRVTTLAEAEPGRRINLEVDTTTQAIVDTVERVLRHRGLEG